MYANPIVLKMIKKIIYLISYLVNIKMNDIIWTRIYVSMCHAQKNVKTVLIRLHILYVKIQIY
jgi:hypothetical protein